MDTYRRLGAEIGALVDEKQAAYGDAFGRAGEVVKAFLRPYRNADGTYTIPEALLDHLLVLVRVIDKMFRIVSNPKGDKMSESPYRDIAGYALLAVKRWEP